MTQTWAAGPILDLDLGLDLGQHLDLGLELDPDLDRGLWS